MKRGGELARSPMKPRTELMSRGNGFERKPDSPRVTERKPRTPRWTAEELRVREIVLKRDGYRCVCCGMSIVGKLYSLGHRLRRGQGGTYTADNLLTFLGDGRGMFPGDHHHRIDTRADPADEEKGYTVRSRKDPARVGVMIFEPSGSGVTMFPTRDGRWANHPPAEAGAA